MQYSELTNKIYKDIATDKSLAEDIKRISEKAKSGTAVYKDAEQFSKKLGDVTAATLKRYTPELSPEELAEYGEEVLKPVYKKTQQVMQSVSRQVQTSINKRGNVHMKPVNAPSDEQMLENLVNKFGEAADLEKVKFLTEENVARSITRKVVTNNVKANAYRQSSAGYQIEISRDDGSGCCNWCSGLVGTYTSFSDLPDDFWAIHRNCNCTIHYKVGRTREDIRFITNDDGSMSKVTE